RSDACEPEISTVTGNVATPEGTVPSTPTALTVAVRPWVAPAGVTTACWPVATWFTCESLTLPVTWKLPGVRSTNAGLDDALDDALDPPTETVEPAVMFTAATCPLIGAVSVAASTDF